jgi:alpha-amylase/alpha-mannosidase (GH57 family)
MPKIKLCFLWHMHQPLYKDLAAGQYRLPWTRLHALKDYFGMVKILEDFPAIHQTFNLVPSLLLQIEEYASGRASDPLFALALKPAEQLSPPETESILKYFFQANEDRVIRRYPRYAQLHQVMKRREYSGPGAISSFDPQMLRDLQVLSHLAWFDEYYIENDPQVSRLVAKGRNYTLEDQKLMGEKQAAALGNVLDVYRQFSERGQIEISTSPFYHPILPLLCDSNIAATSHPYLPLPNRFCWPQDAEEQLVRARDYMRSKFAIEPQGMWPSEGAVSDATLALAAKVGFRWTASDNGILEQTLPSAEAFMPCVWRQDGREIDIVFRDRRLSDLIGFVYSRMDPDEAARHFIQEVQRAASAVIDSGRDALIPIILDGENAWESYVQNGRPFLKELYALISANPEISALTMTEAIGSMDKRELNHVYPGSWIDANFDIWIGDPENNLAWEHLREARAVFDRVTSASDSGTLLGNTRKTVAVSSAPHQGLASSSTVWRRASAPFALSAEARNSAYEALLIAEGSDWFWWYGREHSSSNKAEFDQLFRDRLANVYHSLGLAPPPALSQPIIHAKESLLHEYPTGLIQPLIEGRLSSPGKWANAGRFRIDQRSGAMHSQRSLLRDLYYGTDGRDMFLRVDWSEPVPPEALLEFRFDLRNPAGQRFMLSVSGTSAGATEVTTDIPGNAVSAALGDLCEAKASLSAMHIRLGEPLFLRVQVFRDGLPIAVIPASGEMELGSGVMAAYAF